ncbi:glycosyltransferase [Cellulosimicrobium sp. 72-3]|uniref:glycosyltransferase n=1 Tax=Cellulosimicrobium sp. 72-3 TaxID=2731680 RepID=UPI00148EB495|nr:glycosyltransferase [Cellulosimicrobium sp. 72-3]
MPVAYRADQGGLHDHVEEIVVSAADDFAITVAGRGGPFLERLERLGVETLAIDFTARDALAELAHAGPWDLIHAHPFESRRIAVQLAEHLEVPLLVTMHGWYTDDIHQWHDKAAAIIAVTPAIATHLQQRTGARPNKFWVVPNHCRTTSEPLQPSSARLAKRLIVASRLDSDFTTTETVVREFLAALRDADDRGWTVSVAGTGSKLPEIAHRLGGLATAARARVEFLGWLSKDELARLTAVSSCCIAPGRSAIDAMGTGTLTILTRQIGSYALPPLGEIGSLHYSAPENKVDGQALYDLVRLVEASDQMHRSLAESHASIVRSMYDPVRTNGLLHALYRETLARVSCGHPRPESKPPSRDA